MADISPEPGKLTITPTHHGEPIARGDLIADFRGDTWLFDSIARMPDPDGRSGKVMVLPTENPSSASLRVFNFEVFPDFAAVPTISPEDRTRPQTELLKPADRHVAADHSGENR